MFPSPGKRGRSSNRVLIAFWWVGGDVLAVPSQKLSLIAARNLVARTLIGGSVDAIVTVVDFPPREASVNKVKRFTVSDGKMVLTLEPAEEGGYLVTSPFDPELVTEAETIEEAFEMAHDAAEGLRKIRAKLFGRPKKRAAAKGT
jgi:predicted RNase H-like HicB family nuclease